MEDEVAAMYNKILGSVFGIALLAGICFQFYFRHKVAKYYKSFYFNLGSEKIWERLIIWSTPIGVLFALLLISSLFR